MKLKFTEQEIKDIRDIIEEYRNVSGELYSYQKKAEEIQDKVIELENNLRLIKDKEDKMMSVLHSKYGQFGLQDIYNAIQ
jgi:predicted patatin/cPLA2 family phospholipase